MYIFSVIVVITENHASVALKYINFMFVAFDQ